MKINTDLVYYKVVALVNSTKAFLFKSYGFDVLPDTLTLEYQLNQITTPNIGRIFVFKYLESAEVFRPESITENGKFKSWKILKGFAVDPRKVKWVCSNYRKYDDIAKFWKESKHSCSISKIAPSGSYTCSSFIPTEIVT